MSDADIIPFPTPEEPLPTDGDGALDLTEFYVEDDEPEPEVVEEVEWATDDETEWESEPDMFTEADGQWVWLPHEEDPTGDVPVGMVAFTIATRCRWMHRHLADGLRAPQTCCYSVLVSTARLPGPVRTPRHWLAEVT